MPLSVIKPPVIITRGVGQEKQEKPPLLDFHQERDREGLKQADLGRSAQEENVRVGGGLESGTLVNLHI